MFCWLDNGRTCDSGEPYVTDLTITFILKCELFTMNFSIDQKNASGFKDCFTEIRTNATIKQDGRNI